MAKDNLWIFSDPRLGSPFHLLYYDFAQGDALHILALKVIGILTGSAMAAINFYYLAAYPLAAITSFYVLRKHGISLYPAATAALLYVFVPGHMIRVYGHLAYSSYYLLPLAIDVILQIAGIGAGEPVRMSRKIWLIPVIISVGIGLNTAYYCFYYCVFLIVAIGYALVCCIWITSIF